MFPQKRIPDEKMGDLPEKLHSFENPMGSSDELAATRVVVGGEPRSSRVTGGDPGSFESVMRLFVADTESAQPDDDTLEGIIGLSDRLEAANQQETDSRQPDTKNSIVNIGLLFDQIEEEAPAGDDRVEYFMDDESSDEEYDEELSTQIIRKAAAASQRAIQRQINSSEGTELIGDIFEDPDENIGTLDDLDVEAEEGADALFFLGNEMWTTVPSQEVE